MSGKAPVPTAREAREAGRESAADIVLAMLITELAVKDSDTGALPDRIQMMADLMTPDILQALKDPFRDNPAFSSAVEDGLLGRIDRILSLSRSMLARTHQIRRDGQQDE